MKITVADEIKELWPETVLGVLRYEADVAESSEGLLAYFDKKAGEIGKMFKMPEISGIEHVEETRNAYKALGKSPSEYRNAAEAMLRRLVKGNGLYHINNVVEINNLISVSSGYSIGSYDLGAIEGDVELRRAPDGEHYKGIGKAAVNIEHLPVLYDRLGAFGNPTSDSTRAMIQTGHREIISVIYSFGGPKELSQWMEKYEELLKKYGIADKVESWTVG